MDSSTVNRHGIVREFRIVWRVVTLSYVIHYLHYDVSLACELDNAAVNIGITLE